VVLNELLEMGADRWQRSLPWRELGQGHRDSQEPLAKIRSEEVRFRLRGESETAAKATAASYEVLLTFPVLRSVHLNAKATIVYLDGDVSPLGVRQSCLDDHLLARFGMHFDSVHSGPKNAENVFLWDIASWNLHSH
jgi:hypothetical protein